MKIGMWKGNLLRIYCEQEELSIELERSMHII